MSPYGAPPGAPVGLPGSATRRTNGIVGLDGADDQERERGVPASREAGAVGLNNGPASREDTNGDGDGGGGFTAVNQ